VIEAQHAEIEVLRAAQEAGQDVIRRLELRLAEVERRLAMDSSAAWRACSAWWASTRRITSSLRGVR
jgi:hypothetical protein